MSPDLDALEAVAKAAKARLADGKWKNELPDGWIWGNSLKGGRTHVAEVRGWGYLTGRGHGALGLSEDEGMAAQKAIGDHIANFGPDDVLALIAEARKVRATEALAGALANTLSALAPLNVAGHPICGLDSMLARRVTEAVQALAAYTAAIAPTQPETGSAPR